MSKRRRTAPLFTRYISANQNSDDDEDEEPELLACPWYQPRITAKAAMEHLQQAFNALFPKNSGLPFKASD